MDMRISRLSTDFMKSLYQINEDSATEKYCNLPLCCADVVISRDISSDREQVSNISTFEVAVRNIIFDQIRRNDRLVQFFIEDK